MSKAERSLMGIGYLVFAFCVLYAIATAAGLAALPSRDVAIQDPYFSIMEALILAIAPLLVCYYVYAVAAKGRDKTAGLLGILFVSFMSIVTCVVHFSVLTVSRPLEGRNEVFNLVFGFTWPSIIYTADILAWDVFFPVSCFFLLQYLPANGRLGKTGKVFWIVGAILSLAGLAGIPLADMQVRLIGVVGYALFTPISILLLSLDIGRKRADPTIASS